MKLSTDYKSILKGIIAGLLVIIGISVVSASNYVGPTQPPTDGNAEAPLNVSYTNQVKSGGLGVGAFTASLNSSFSQKLGVGMVPDASTPVDLDVNGKVGANLYCNQTGDKCIDPTTGGGTGGTGSTKGSVVGGFWWYNTNSYSANHGVWGTATAKGTSWYSVTNYVCPTGSTAYLTSKGVWSGPDNRDGSMQSYLCITN